MSRPMDAIACLYCFKTFAHDEVHFRMETVLTVNELDTPDDSLGEVRHFSREDIQNDMTIPEDRKAARLAEWDRREHFLEGEEAQYNAFWKDYNGTTENEEVKVGIGETMRTIQSNQMPVSDPQSYPELFAADPLLRHNDTGFVFGAKDSFGRETYRRVCPFCHNPLPGAYGEDPVKFISIIGITAAGKTVFLSQLCRYLTNDLADFDISVTPLSTYPAQYRHENKVELGAALPAGTAPELLLQPLCFNLVYAKNHAMHTQTLVFYDIAGENCHTDDVKGLAAGAIKFGPFIVHSDAIMLLIPPSQIKAGMIGKDSVVDTIAVVQALFAANPGGIAALEKLPVAISISKGDMVEGAILGSGRTMQNPEAKQDVHGRSLQVFNAEDYNDMQTKLCDYVTGSAKPLITAMRTTLHQSDLFLVSALGVPVGKSQLPDGSTVENVLLAPPSPKRLTESLLWILTKFGYVQSSGFINEIDDWNCMECKRRLHSSDQYCPVCHLDIEGRWHCGNCGAMHDRDVEWCMGPDTKGKKCKLNRFGEKKGLFGMLKS